jgi:hypothetical protein
MLLQQYFSGNQYLITIMLRKRLIKSHYYYDKDGNNDSFIIMREILSIPHNRVELFQPLLFDIYDFEEEWVFQSFQL